MISDFLKAELIKAKGHVPEIGRKAGVPNTTMQSWATGGKKPTLDNAEKVLNAMGYELVIKQIRSNKNDNGKGNQ